MTVTMYMNEADTRTVDKSSYLRQIIEFDSVKFKDEVNTINAILVINSSDADLNKKVNYVYIHELDRYYYITDYVLTPNKLLQLSLKEDVLMTFKADIKELVGTVDRNEFEKSGYLVDGEYITQAYEQIVTKTFPHGLNDNSLVLMVVD